MNGRNQHDEFRILPSTAGKRWLMETWEYLRINNRPLIVAILLLGLVWALAAVPVFGIVISILTPVFTAGLLLGIRAGFRKKITRINILAGWEQPEPRKQLVFLGLLMVVVSLLVAYLAGPDLNQLQEAIIEGNVLWASFERVIIIFFTGYALVGFSTWLALPEIAFTGHPVLPALILSIRATLANWRALSMLGLWLTAVWLVAIFVVSMVSALLITVLGAYMGGFVATIPMLILWLLLLALMFVLQYVCWRDILGDPAAENEPEDQATAEDEGPTQVVI